MRGKAGPLPQENRGLLLLLSLLRQRSFPWPYEAAVVLAAVASDVLEGVVFVPPFELLGPTGLSFEAVLEPGLVHAVGLPIELSAVSISGLAKAPQRLVLYVVPLAVRLAEAGERQ